MNKQIAVTALLLLVACKPTASVPPEAPAVAPAQAKATTPPAPPVAEASAVPADAAATPDDSTAVNQAIDDALGDHARYEPVIRQLQQAVAARDAAAVAALVDYPFDTVRDGKPLKIADAAEFAREYDRIVTPDIARAITTQKYSQLMVNYKGVMFGNGEAWVNGICVDDACKDFNVRVVALQPGP